jgi:hypothetical protein
MTYVMYVDNMSMSRPKYCHRLQTSGHMLARFMICISGYRDIHDYVYVIFFIGTCNVVRTGCNIS